MYDFILRNGTIVDGTGKKTFVGSIGISGKKIEAISKDENLEGKEILDCTDLVISPGFIDLHTHSDACPLNKSSGDSMINQGVTLQIGGNCGISLIPSTPERKDEIRSFFERTVEVLPDDSEVDLYRMDDYLIATSKIEQVINTGLLVGHGTLRAVVMGFDDRKPTDDEMEAMKDLLDSELKSGAFGMSLGLIYPPSSYGKIEEIVELAKVVKENNGIMTTHMRNEGDLVFQSVDEMIEVALKSKVHMHISHLKLMGKDQWGKSKELLSKIEDAIKQGATITCDQYPYDASATGLAALLPGWAMDGGNAAMLKNLEERCLKLISAINSNLEKRGGPDKVLISSTNGAIPSVEGKYIGEIAKAMKVRPAETVIKLLLECKGAVAAVYFSMDMDDILEIMKKPYISIGSDGSDFGYNINYNPHPRNFGTFPKFLKMVREYNMMPLEDAIYKISGLPSEILKLNDRGTLKVGNIADITVFDKNTIQDTATFAYSPVKPLGIHHVFVAGNPTIKNGDYSNIKAGKIIKSTER